MKVENLATLQFSVTDFRRLGAPKEHFDDRIGANLVEVSSNVRISGVSHHLRVRKQGDAVVIDSKCLEAICAAHYWRIEPRRFVSFVDGLMQVESRAAAVFAEYLAQSGEAYALPAAPVEAGGKVDGRAYFVNRARDARAAIWGSDPEMVASSIDVARSRASTADVRRQTS